MTRTVQCVAALAGMLLFVLPAHAQRVFVSGSGSDSNPCTYAAPCRTFQQAFNTVAANGEIDVLDPAGYGPLDITHGISIQGHGFGGITAAAVNTAAILIVAGSSDAITLNGLLIDGAGTGDNGVTVDTAGSVQILNCVIRHFTNYGISFGSSNNNSELLVSDTVVSDNVAGGIFVQPSNGATGVDATLQRIAAADDGYGVIVDGGQATIVDSALFDNNVGVGVETGAVYLTGSLISGNTNGVYIFGGTADSYGDNAINNNSTMDISGSLTPVSTQ